MAWRQPPQELVDAMVAAAVAANERIRTAHEHVACPTCSAPVGKKCRSMPRGYRPLDAGDRVRELKTAHKRRWRLVQPER